MAGITKEMATIADAMDKTTGDGRDHAKAVDLADKYVAKHPDEFKEMEALTLEQCVQEVEHYRNVGRADKEQLFEIWLLHKFEPQNIGGTAQPKVRVPSK